MGENKYLATEDSDVDILPALLCLKKQIFQINYDSKSHTSSTQDQLDSSQLLINSLINHPIQFENNNEEDILPQFYHFTNHSISEENNSNDESSNLPNLINENSDDDGVDFLFNRNEPCSPTRMRLLTHDSKNSPISNQVLTKNDQLIDKSNNDECEFSVISPRKALIAVLSVPEEYEPNVSTADFIKNIMKSSILTEEQAPYDPHCVFTSNKGVLKCGGGEVLDYCVLGCICSSLNRDTSSSTKKSCGNFACIFGCLCGGSKYEMEDTNGVNIVTRLRSRAHLLLHHSFFKNEREKRDRKVEECKKRENKKMSCSSGGGGSAATKRKRANSPKILKTVQNIDNNIKNNAPKLLTTQKKYNFTKIFNKEDVSESYERRVPNFSESFLEKFFISMITEFPEEGEMSGEDDEDEDEKFDEITKEEVALNIIKGIKLAIRIRSQKRNKKIKRK